MRGSPAPDGAQLKGAIVYQLEPLANLAKPEVDVPRCVEKLRHAREIWDYSLENIALLQSLGFHNVKHLPLGYHEQLCTIPDAEPDIDVFFYGNVNPRRQKVLMEVAAGCRAVLGYGVYGERRDASIARSKRPDVNV